MRGSSVVRQRSNLLVHARERDASAALSSLSLSVYYRRYSRFTVQEQHDAFAWAFDRSPRDAGMRQETPTRVLEDACTRKPRGGRCHGRKL